MLNKEEEYKLDVLVATITTSKNGGFYPRMSAYDIEWLARKLEESNEECTALRLRIDQLEGRA